MAALGAATTIGELAADVAGGLLSPVTLVRQCLDRIGDYNARLNAMIFVDGEAALESARRAEHEIAGGRYRGPLHGIPIAVKDVIDVAGLPTTSGSRLFDGTVAAADADCVAKLKAAGAIVVGKTNLHELTVGNHANPWFGTVVNPLSASHGTGGTSSGSAAAVAAGFCLAALGTDTGGSNRSTAAATGLFGFKPTNGLVDASGVRPTAPSLDTVGAIARSANDLALLLSVMRTGPAQQPRHSDETDIPRFALGLCPDLYGSPLDPVVETALAAWLDRVRNAGARTVELRFGMAEGLAAAGSIILRHEFSVAYRHRIETAPELVGEAVHAFLSSAATVTEAAYGQALALRSHCRKVFSELLRSVDALVLPTSPGLAPRIDDELTEVGLKTLPYGAAGMRFRMWANMLGLPAVAMPVAAGGRLPASLQLAGLPGSDEILLGLAAALGRAAPGTGCFPR